MKKTLVVIFVLALTLTLTSLAFAQENKLAFFKFDSDLATAGYQGGSAVDEIGGAANVGFAIYVKNVDALQTFNVDFSWDGSKASMSGRDSSTDSEEYDITINGQEITLAEETNVLESIALNIGKEEGDGFYREGFGKSGDPIVSEEFGLLYLIVLKTADSFTVGDSFTITAKVNVGSPGGVIKYLGERIFYVNGAVDVKTSTWGEVKTQFKDF